MKLLYRLLIIVGLVVCWTAIVYRSQPVSSIQFFAGALIAWLAWCLLQTEKDL